jgi:hypothetical protein
MIRRPAIALALRLQSRPTAQSASSGGIVLSRSFSVLSRDNENDLIETATKMWINDFVLAHRLCPWAAGVWNSGETKVTVFSRKPEGEDEDVYILDVVEEACKEAMALMTDDEVYAASLSAVDADEMAIAIAAEQEEYEEEEEAKESASGQSHPDAIAGGDHVSHPSILAETISAEKSSGFVKREGAEYSTTLIAVPEFRDFDTFLNIIDIIEESLAAARLTDHIQVASFHPKYIFAGNSAGSVDNFTNRSPFPLIHLLRVQDVADAVTRHTKGRTGRKAAAIMDEVWKRNSLRMQRVGHDALKRQLVETVKNAIVELHLNRARTPVKD